jgi:hypothetical protein
MQQQAQIAQALGEKKGHRRLGAELSAGSLNYLVVPVSAPDALAESQIGRLMGRGMLAVQ